MVLIFEIFFWNYFWLIECLLEDFSLKDLKRNRKEKEDHYTESVKSLNHLFSSNTMVGMMKIMIFSDNWCVVMGIPSVRKEGEVYILPPNGLESHHTVKAGIKGPGTVNS